MYTPNPTIAYPQPYNKIGDGPEGPEVRTVADKLLPVLVNSFIIDFLYTSKSKGSGFNLLSKNTQIVDVKSYGKKLLFYTDKDILLVYSLGMTGKVLYTEGNHSHIKIVLGRQSKFKSIFIYKCFDIFFDDQRCFGKLDVINVSSIDSYFSKIGPDLLQHALTEPISKKMWFDIFKKRKTRKMIIEILIDQSYVSGIGWYLATDILYYCKILPKRKMTDITDEELELLRIYSHNVIVDSYNSGGFTIESFISPDGTIGAYNSAIYGKKYDVNGFIVRHEKLSNGRTSHFVTEIQT